jgi:NADH-quinone oxidoreductase subunit N
VIAAFLYLRIMVSVWLSDAADGDAAEPIRVPFSSGLAITLCVGFTLLVGFFPNWLIDASDKVVEVARPAVLGG